MSKYVKPLIIVDPSFVLPAGAQGIVNDDTFMPDQQIEDDDVDFLPVPQTFTVISQIPRYDPSGSLVIDLVVEVDDFDSVEKFEVRKSRT